MFGQNQRWIAKFGRNELKNLEKNGNLSGVRATT